LTEVIRINPGLAGTVILVSKIYDTITNPFESLLSDRTRTRWGRPDAPLDWLPDHYDAPPYFVLLLDEYIQASDDRPILQEEIDGSACTMRISPEPPLAFRRLPLCPFSL